MKLAAALRDGSGVIGAVTGTVQPGKSVVLDIVITDAAMRRIAARTYYPTTLAVGATDAVGNNTVVSVAQRLRAN